MGSEGTFGIITEVTVRLYPQPEAVSAAVCPFPEVAGAVDTVIRTIQRGVPIARAERLDALTVAAVNRYSQTGLKEQPMLFLEFHGTPANIAKRFPNNILNDLRAHVPADSRHDWPHSNRW